MAKMTLKFFSIEFGWVEVAVNYTLYSKDVIINSVSIPLDPSPDDTRDLKDQIKKQLKLERECRFADEDRHFADHVENEVMGAV